MPIVLPDFLVSAAAGERYAKWKMDLNKASMHDDSESDKDSGAPVSKAESEEPSSRRVSENVELAGFWNESQPYSPRVIATDLPHSRATYEVAETTDDRRKRNLWSSNEPGNDGQSSVKIPADEDDETFIDDSPYSFQSRITRHNIRTQSSDGYSDFQNVSEDGGCTLPSPLVQPPPTRAATPSSRDPRLSGRMIDVQHVTGSSSRQDDITDTVGAIAIDCRGNIAAGSSSGGIGMKHKGRVGPAALVGIGTAVIPVDSEDKDKTSVATVTSGTGEHMATTMAAGTCASRLYTSTRKTKKGESESTDDDSAIRAFVERDFMSTLQLTLPFCFRPNLDYF